MIDVIGTDAGAPETLPAQHQKLIRETGWLAAPRRLHPALRAWLMDDDRHELIASDNPRQLCAQLARRGRQPSVVLASGDPLWFGIGRLLLDRLGPERLRFHPAPSAMQLAFARIGHPWQNTSCVSLHGRDPQQLSRELQKRPSALAVLTDPDRGGAEAVRSTLLNSGLAAVYQFWVCANLGHPEEKVQLFSTEKALPEALPRLLMVVLIAISEPPLPERPLPLFGLDDGLYRQHPDHPGLMTKREVRLQLLADLDLPPQGVLWDLGAGTGSIGLEALRLRPDLQLLAVERRGGGAELIRANATRLKVEPAAILEIDARDLPRTILTVPLDQPDRVLLGGGGADRCALLRFTLERLRPEGVVVIPLATIEAIAELRPLLEEAGLRVSLSQLQAWRGQVLADGTRLAPMNPTLILKGTKTTRN